MKSLILSLLTIFAVNASADEPCKHVTFGSHRMDLARPWPIEYLSDRHAQIQALIARSAGLFVSCGAIEGDLKFTITEKGEMHMDNVPSTIPSQVECFEQAASRVHVGINLCGFEIPYKWNGKLPLVNEDAKTFP